MLLLRDIFEEIDMPIKGLRSWISLTIFATLSAFQLPANAADLSWSGLYRVEGLHLKNSEMDALKRDKAYGLHHLILMPKMIAADGLNIYGRFDIMNNQTFGANSQLGQFLGSGVRPTTTPADSTTSALNSNVLSQHEHDELITVTQLYATWTHEFGQLIVGRAPLQFGLGITHNAGYGLFDHWFDTRDLIGYKVVFGNTFVLPMIGKVDEGLVDVEDDVNDYMIQIGYENPESDLALGLFVEWRVTTRSGNDAPETSVSPTPSDLFGGPNSTITKGYNHRLINLFVREKFSDFSVGLEAGLVNGETGVNTAAGAQVKMNGYGIATEFGYARPDSKWDFGLRAGIASGDDPGTPDTYEGFIFDRNYDTAFILFTHPLGQGDFLRTGLANDGATARVTSSRSVDEEEISNAIYVSPRFQHRFKDNLSWGSTVTWATLNKAPYPGTARDLGVELDLNLTYKPYERMTWLTEVGALFPGDAWKGGPTQNFDNKLVWGVSTKAAISF